MGQVLMDSGASYRLTHNLINARTISPPKCFRIADGRTVEIAQVGDLRMCTLLTVKEREYEHELVVPNVFHVPGLSFTLLSVYRLVQSGDNVVFSDNEWAITRGKKRQPILQARPVIGVYVVATRDNQASDAVASTAVETARDQGPSPSRSK